MVAAISLVSALEDTSLAPWGYICVISVVGFVVAVFQHLRARSDASHQLALATVNAEARHKLYRRWDRIRPMEKTAARTDAAELTDLHIVGEGSLAHLLNTVSTPGGKTQCRPIF
ncbi:MAG: hypothetical protein LC637_04185 [Xanthomonadaceae bacterium]|nr:hypothetical protein [Xanthomonadaceae bacterium]